MHCKLVCIFIKNYHICGVWCVGQITFKGPPVCRVAAGGEFSAIADVVGNLYTFGNPEYGQLGRTSLVVLIHLYAWLVMHSKFNLIQQKLGKNCLWSRIGRTTYLWPWLAVSCKLRPWLQTTAVTYSRTKVQGQRSVTSKDGVETSSRTDSRRWLERLHYLLINVVNNWSVGWHSCPSLVACLSGYSG